MIPKIKKSKILKLRMMSCQTIFRTQAELQNMNKRHSKEVAGILNMMVKVATEFSRYR
ncbi:hypothetical protein [Companilactobacillus paralimentarius]|uniref:hypothetical protein n=1 Tax=Companilactobacillus paralimentarius TaxID=83526 RepID=UPI00186B7520|nr:hypothetical protein [Companilactobacillus paralimentarius]